MRYTTLALTLIAGVRPDAPAADRMAADAAQRELGTFVTDAARRVHGRYGYLRPQPAADFVADAPGRMAVVLIEKFGPFHATLVDASLSEDPAAGFLYTAVNNHYLTVARRRLPGQLAAAADGESDSAMNPFDRLADDGRRPRVDPPASLTDAADFWSAPLGAADRRVVADWRPIDAAVLLLLSGLHPKLPAADWSAVLDRCDVIGPVPSAGTLALPDGKRRDGLALDLGITRNGLDQIWSRKRERLLELPFVRRVRHDHPGRGAA